MARFEPLWQQAGSYAAQLDRMLLAALWPSGGVLGGAVTAAFNTMNVNLAAGYAAVPLQAGQGAALCRWDSPEVVTLTASPPTGQSRIDLIVAQVRDAAIDAGPNNDFIFAAVAGVPAASNPAVPATPPNALAVATVTVAGAIANLNAAPIVRVAPPIAPLANPYVARMYRQAAINGNGGGVRMPYDNLSFDPNNNISGLGGSPVYNVPVPGRYLVTARGGVSGPTVQTRVFLSVLKNGVEVARGGDQYSPATVPCCAVVNDVIPAGPGDQLWISVFQQTSNGFDIGTALNYATFALVTS